MAGNRENFPEFRYLRYKAADDGLTLEGLFRMQVRISLISGNPWLNETDPYVVMTYDDYECEVLPYESFPDINEARDCCKMLAEDENSRADMNGGDVNRRFYIITGDGKIVR